MNFSEILSSTKRNGDVLDAPIPNEWTQGRSAFGGLAAALAYHGVRKLTEEKRPLRGAMISFVGPTSDNVTIDVTPLRSGRTSGSVRSSIKADGVSATEALFTFAELREDSNLEFEPPKSPAEHSPISDPSMEAFRPPFPTFYKQFEVVPVFGLPFQQTKTPDIYWWIRHIDPAHHQSMEGLLAIGDAMIPAYGTKMNDWAPMSSMNWMINMLTDNPQTEDGWWLLRSTADSANGGYTSQNMAIWNTNKECVFLGRQMVTIFD